MDLGDDGGWSKKGGKPRAAGFARIVALALCVGISTATGFTSGCGTGPALPGSASSAASAAPSGGGGSSTTGAARPGPTTSITSSADSYTTEAGPLSQSALARTFAAIARATAPLPAYGLTELPPGVAVSATWWPVLSMSAPGDYTGPAVSNPRIGEGGPGAREVQLVLESDGGWLLLLENFRGDLGDVSGSPVGQVAGHAATLYGLADGSLVQWSDRGAWYGVFGRGLPPAEVVGVALGMVLLDPGH
jgi:hypothetical protein